jgi:virginiamycin B lyase
VDLASHRDRAPSPCAHYDLGARTLGPIAPGPGAGATLIALDGGGLLAARVSGGGAVTRIRLPQSVVSVRGLARARDGTHWFTAGALIGRIGLDGGVALFRSPVAAGGGIAAGPDGAMWFTAARAIGRIDGDGATRIFPLPVNPAGGIVQGPGGALWFSARSHVGRLATDGALRLFALPGSLSATGAVTGAGDGRLWFVDSRHHRLGRIGSGGRAVGFGLPGRPFGIARGPDPATVWTTLRRSNGQNWIARMTIRGFSSQRPPGLRCDAFVPPACWFGFQHVPAGTLLPLNALAAPAGVALGGDRRIWFAESGRAGAVIPFRGVRVCARPPSTSDLIGIRCTHPAVPNFRLTHGGAPYVELTCPRYTLRYCAGTVDLRVAGGGELLGRGHYVLHPNDNPRVRVPLSGHGVSLVRRAGRLVVDATMNAHDGGGLRRVIHARIGLVPAG